MKKNTEDRKVEIAQVMVKINKTDTVPKQITPTEFLILWAGLSTNAGGNPFTKFQIFGTVNLTPEQERAQLTSRYGNLKYQKAGSKDAQSVLDLIPAVLPTKFEGLANFPPGDVEVVRRNYVPKAYAPEPEAGELMITQTGLAPVEEEDTPKQLEVTPIEG